MCRKCGQKTGKMIYSEQGRTEHAKIFNLKWKLEIIQSDSKMFYSAICTLNPF